MATVDESLVQTPQATREIARDVQNHDPVLVGLGAVEFVEIRSFERERPRRFYRHDTGRTHETLDQAHLAEVVAGSHLRQQDRKFFPVVLHDVDFSLADKKHPVARLALLDDRRSSRVILLNCEAAEKLPDCSTACRL